MSNAGNPAHPDAGAAAASPPPVAGGSGQAQGNSAAAAGQPVSQSENDKFKKPKHKTVADFLKSNKIPKSSEKKKGNKSRQGGKTDSIIDPPGKLEPERVARASVKVTAQRGRRSMSTSSENRSRSDIDRDSSVDESLSRECRQKAKVLAKEKWIWHRKT